MKVLGLLFILVGLWLCFTILLAGLGLPVIGLGTLIFIAGRGSPSGRVAKVVQVTLGSLIGISVVWAGIAFIGLASGVKPTLHHTPAAARQMSDAPHSSPTRHSAKVHPVTH